MIEVHIPPASLCSIEEFFPGKGIHICREFCSAFNLCSDEVLERTTDLRTQFPQSTDLKRGTSSGPRCLCQMFSAFAKPSKGLQTFGFLTLMSATNPLSTHNILNHKRTIFLRLNNIQNC